MNRKQMRADALKDAQAIVDGAKAAGRATLTPDERSKIDEYIATVDRLDAEIAQEAKDGALWDQLTGSLPAYESWDDMMDRLKEQDGAKGSISRAKSMLTASIQSKANVSVNLPRKAFTTGALDAPGADGGIQAPTAGTAAVSLRELFPIKRVDAPAVRYYTVGRIDGIDVVKEGELKPELTTDYAPHDASLVKLAGHMQHTLEFGQDAPELLRTIFGQVQLDMVRKENKLIIDAMTAAEGAIVKTGTEAGALDVLVDAIGEQESLNGLTPDVLVAHPTDLAGLRKLKSGGSQDYIIDLFSTHSAGPFGTQVLPTAVVPAGTMWLLRREAGTWYEHVSGVTVMNGYVGDGFARNVSATVFEERVLAVINQPGLLTKITLS